MQLNITFRQFGASESLKEYAREKVERVTKYLDRAGEAYVVLSLERHLHHADITIHSGRWVLRGKEKSEDMYASIDLAMDKIESQLRRYKEKLKNHHGRERVHHRQDLMAQLKVRHKILELAEEPELTELEPELEQAAPAPALHAQPPAATLAAVPGAAEPSAQASPKVVRSTDILIKTLSVDDAVMQMDLMNNDFYVFQNAATHEVCVLYRRKDGQLGLIEAHPPAPPAVAAAG